MSTFIIGMVVLLFMVLAVKSIIKTKKSGSCGCGCENCSSHCHNIEHK